MPIEYLKRVVIDHGENGVQTSRPPNNEEIMDKINDLISLVNKIEKETIESNMLKGRN